MPPRQLLSSGPQISVTESTPIYSPILSVSDATVLSQWADNVVFVVRSDYTAYQVAAAGIKHLQKADAKILGAALSHVDVDRHSRYGKYGYYGEYYGTYQSTR